MSAKTETKIMSLIKDYSLEISNRDDLFDSLEDLIHSHRSHRETIRFLYDDLNDLRANLIDDFVTRRGEELLKNNYVSVEQLKTMTLVEVAELIA